jgi:hypothetical protein
MYVILEKGEFLISLLSAVMSGVTCKLGTWEMLIQRNVDLLLISKKDKEKFKRILELANGNLANNERLNKMKITGGMKYDKVISKLFLKNTGVQRWTTCRQ